MCMACVANWQLSSALIRLMHKIHNSPEIVTYCLTIRTTEMFYKDRRNGAGPMKEEISGQNWLGHIHQVHVLR